MNKEMLFELLRAAYIRGGHWMAENGGAGEYLLKAATDYADKETSDDGENRKFEEQEREREREYQERAAEEEYQREMHATHR